MPRCKSRSILLNDYHTKAISIFLCAKGKTGISELTLTIDTIDYTGWNPTINDF